MSTEKVTPGSQLVNIIRFYDPNLFVPFATCKTEVTVQYFRRLLWHLCIHGYL